MEEEYSEIETEISEKVSEECNEEIQDDNSEENDESNSSKENLTESSQTENELSESSEEELTTTKRRRVSMIREVNSEGKPVKKKKSVKQTKNNKNAKISTPKQKKSIKRTNSKLTTKQSNSTPSQSNASVLNTPAPIIPHNLEEPTLSIFLIFYNSNRPTSATELSLAFPKKAVATALDELVEKNLLTMKTYNKTKMYMLNTNVCDYETEDMYDNRLETLKERLSNLKEELSNIQKGLSEIQNQMTLDDLKEKIELRKEQMKINTTNIHRIETGDLCTEIEVEDIRKRIKTYEKTLKERKSIFKTALDTLSENLNKKKNELLEEMGILED